MTRRLATALAAVCVLVATLAPVLSADAAVVWDVKRIGDSGQGWLSVDHGVAAWDSFDGVRVWRAATGKLVIAPGTSKAIVSDVVVLGGQVYWLETVGDYWTGRGVVRAWRVGARRARAVASRPHIQRGSLRVAGRRLCWSEAGQRVVTARWRTRTLDGGPISAIPGLKDRSADVSLAENVLAFGTLDWTRSVGVVPVALGASDRVTSLPSPKVIARAPSAMYLQGTLAANGDRVAWAARTPDNTDTVMAWSPDKSAPRVLGTAPAAGQTIAVSQNRLAWVSSSAAGTQTIVSWTPGDSVATSISIYPTPVECYGVRASDRRLIWFTSSSNATSTLSSWEADGGDVSTIPVTLSRGTAGLSEDVVVVVGETGGDTRVSVARPMHVAGPLVAPAPAVPWWIALLGAAANPMVGVAVVAALALGGLVVVIAKLVDERR